MNTIAIKSSKNKIMVTFDKTELNVNILLRFLDRLEIEQAAAKVDFSKDILKIAEEIKTKWWIANKKRLLKSKPIESSN
jgi:hypothetical protein